MMKIKAVVFDFDGVIMETEPYHIEAFRKVFRKDFGVSLSYNDVLAYAGLTHSEKIRRLCKEKDIPIKHDPEEVREKILRMVFDSIEKDIKNNFIKIPHGLLNLLESLKGKYKIGMATMNKRKYSLEMLRLLDIEKYFDAIITFEDVEKIKPHPEVYIKIAKMLGENPENCIAIEDSVYGIQSAKAAGMKCVAIASTNPREKLKEADMIIERFEEIDVEKL